MEKLKSKAVHGLKWLEQYTKTDMLYLARGGSWLGLGQLISMTVAFLLSLAFANLLPRETYGTYKYILSIVALLSIPTLSGMDSAVTQAVARGFEGAIFDGLKVKLRFGILTTLAGIVLSGYYFLNDNTILGYGFIIASFAIPLWESFDIYSSFLNGRKLFNKFAQYYSLVQIFSALIIFVSLLITKDIIFILLAYFVSNTLIRILFFRKVVDNFHPNSQRDPQTISFGKHLSFMDIIGTLLGQLDKVLIFHYLGAQELALYTIALAPTEQIKGALKNIHTLALPRFASRTKQEVKENIFDKAIKLSILIGVISIIYIICAPLFYKLFFPTYLDAVPYSQIAALSLIGASVSMFLYTFFESHSEKISLYKFNIFSNIINIGIVFVMIYFYGLWGAILSRIIIRTLLLMFSIYLVKKT